MKQNTVSQISQLQRDSNKLRILCRRGGEGELNVLSIVRSHIK